MKLYKQTLKISKILRLFFMNILISRMSDERLSDWQKQRRADRMISETFFIMKLTTPLLIILLLSYLTAQ